MISWFKNLFDLNTVLKSPQLTFIYCSNCRNELCSSNSFISDTYDENGDNHVLYKCSSCGEEYDYNFDIAPVPVNWDCLK